MQTGKLLPYIPKHITYVEVFGGGASLLFAKEPSNLEVYNDIDSGLFALFSCLSDPNKFAQLYMKIALSPYSRELYYTYRNDWNVEDILERAYRFYIKCRQGFTANHDKTGWSYSSSNGRNTPVTRWLSCIDRLPDIHARLRLVQVDKLDFQKLLDKYDSPQTFFYIDPPYYGISGLYEHDFTEHDHERLLLSITKLKGMVMLSNYRNDLYSILDEVGWLRVDYNVKSLMNIASTTDSNRTESIWMNYAI